MSLRADTAMSAIIAVIIKDVSGGGALGKLGEAWL
jgi:hypothetical protein